MNYKSVKRQIWIAAFFLAIIVALLLYLLITNVSRSDRFSGYEIRLYIILAIVAMFAVVIVLLGVRNAIVSNTAYLIRLKNSTDKLELTNRGVDKSNSQLKDEIKKLNKQLQSNQNEKK